MLGSLKFLFYIEALLMVGMTVFHFALNRPERSLVAWGYRAAVLVIPVVGLFGQTKNVFYGLLVLLPLLAIGDRRRIACLYVLLLPLFPDLGGNYVVGGVYLGDFSASRALGLGALLALAATPVGRARRASAIDVSIWIMFMTSIILSARGIPVTGVLRVLHGAFLSIVVPFYVVSRAVRTERDAVDISLFFILSGLCNAVVALFEARRSWPLFEAFYRALNVEFGLSASVSIRGGLMRAHGALNNNTVLSVLLALAVVTCLALRPRFSRMGFRMAMALLVGGLFCSQSRGGWAAAGVGVLLYWLYERRTTAVVALTGVAAVASIAVLALPSEGRVGQILGRSGGAESTADYRSDLLARGLEEFRKRPLSGYGRDELEVAMNDMRQGQNIIDFVNTHLFVALRGGIIGLLAWLVAWSIPMLESWKARPPGDARGRDAAMGLPFALIGSCLVAMTFTSTIDRMFPLLAVSMGLAGGLLVARRHGGVARRRARPQGSPESGLAGLGAVS